MRDSDRFERMPKNPYWHDKGGHYEVCLGETRYLDQGGHHTRTPLWIRDKRTGKTVKRIGDGHQMGNWHPVWINRKGKKIQVEKLLDQGA